MPRIDAQVEVSPLKAVRYQSGFTVGEVAYFADISEGHLFHVEAQRARLTEELSEKLRKIYQYPQETWRPIAQVHGAREVHVRPPQAQLVLQVECPKCKEHEAKLQTILELVS